MTDLSSSDSLKSSVAQIQSTSPILKCDMCKVESSVKHHVTGSPDAMTSKPICKSLKENTSICIGTHAVSKEESHHISKCESSDYETKRNSKCKQSSNSQRIVKSEDSLERTAFEQNDSSKSYVSVSTSPKDGVEGETFACTIDKSTNASSLNPLFKILNKKQSNASVENSKKHVSLQNSKASQFVEALSCPEFNEGARHAQVKTKIKSMWNNMKYGWRMKREVNLKTDSAIWLLGQCYHNKLSDSSVITTDVSEQLRHDLMSKIWLTYRINFPAIPGTNLVTDSGWGCMLRSGQMMMAQAFVCHYLQRSWRLPYDQTKMNSQMYKMILRWFGDSLSENSPFSLHHLVLLGENYGRKAGDWYGPTHAAHVLRDALLEVQKHNSLFKDLSMYVASDGIVFKQDVLDLFIDKAVQDENNIVSLNEDIDNMFLTEAHDIACQERHTENVSMSLDYTCSGKMINEDPLKSFEQPCPSYSAYGPPSYSTVKCQSKSLIIFVSVRLGNDKINPFYIPCLKSLLAYEHCIGIIGGRPKHALYFIGWQDDKIIHLDPHSCQPAINVETEDFSGKTFHSSSIRTMSFCEMDPSCAIGFYFRELQEFHLFVEKFSEITAPLKRNLEYPVFALAEGKRIEIEDDTDQPHEKCLYTSINSSSCNDDDDYILL